jgi:hypothetical protein
MGKRALVTAVVGACLLTATVLWCSGRVSVVATRYHARHRTEQFFQREAAKDRSPGTPGRPESQGVARGTRPTAAEFQRSLTERGQ